MTCPNLVGLFFKWEDLSFYKSTGLASCSWAIRGRQLYGYLEACRISTVACLNGKQMARWFFLVCFSSMAIFFFGLFSVGF
ncbi:hypothetical protein CEXT_3041 [Caerostris extrusa]|uniref:Uncharacterized protein n=1 Tax=Caerostris extrusa TaxID=172846 RepID=A0AAV4VL61_CAEEX|nr:hypothetical protein CEXT_3041 [Caerostris extrusa]